MIKKNCPSCGKETIYGAQIQFPFCSARCRDGDLLGWAKGERSLSTPITDADEVMDYLERHSEDFD